MKASWKTTLFGALAAVGVYLEGIGDPAWLAMVGKFLTVVSTALLGFFARDNNVSSEAAGVVTPTETK